MIKLWSISYFWKQIILSSIFSLKVYFDTSTPSIAATANYCKNYFYWKISSKNICDKKGHSLILGPPYTMLKKERRSYKKKRLTLIEKLTFSAAENSFDNIVRIFYFFMQLVFFFYLFCKVVKLLRQNYTKVLFFNWTFFNLKFHANIFTNKHWCF